MLEKLKNKSNILIILLMILGIFLRVFLFGSVPGGHNQDESMASLNAQSILYNGADIYGNTYPPILEAWGVAPMNSLMSYLMIPFIYLFGANLITIRLPMLIASIISLPFVYLLGKELKDKKFGIILLFLTVISPWHIIQSRWALEANLFPQMILFGFYFLIRTYKHKFNAYISMIFFALSMYCYGISYYSIPFILIIASIILYKNKLVNVKDIIICILIYMTLSIPIILTVFNNFFNWGDFKLLNMTIPYLSDNNRTSDVLFFSDNIFFQFLLNLGCLVFFSFIQILDTYHNSIPYFGRTYIYSTIFLIIGVIIYNKRIFKDKDYKTKLISIWFIFSIISGIITNFVNVNRVNIIFYPILIFTSYGLYFISEKYKEVFKLILFIYIMSLFLFSLFYYSDSYKRDRISFYDLEECINYIEEYLEEEIVYMDGMFSADNKGFINSAEVIIKDVLKYYKPGTEINNKYEYADVDSNFVIENSDCYIVALLDSELELDLDLSKFECIYFDRFVLIKK